MYKNLYKIKKKIIFTEKMKYLFLFILLSFNILSFSQINKKFKFLPKINSNFLYNTTSRLVFDVDLNKKGKQKWDFSNLRELLTCKIEIRNPKETDYFNYFPSSNYCDIQKFFDRTIYTYKKIEHKKIYILGNIEILDSITVLNKTLDSNFTEDYTFTNDTTFLSYSDFYSVHKNKVLQYEYKSINSYKIVKNSYGRIKLPKHKSYKVFLEKEFHTCDSIFIDNKFQYITNDPFEVYNWYTINRKGFLILVMSYYIDRKNNIQRIIYLARKQAIN